MDTVILILTAFAWALWWWLFREARRAEKEDPYRESVRIAGEGMER